MKKEQKGKGRRSAAKAFLARLVNDQDVQAALTKALQETAKPVLTKKELWRLKR